MYTCTSRLAMVATDSGRHRYQVKFDVEMLYGGDVYLLIHFY